MIPHATRAKSNINTLCAVRNGTFWAGYGGDGLHECAAVFAERQGLTERRAFRHAINQPNSLSNDVILSLYFDRTGGLWAGTDGGGVSYAHPDEYRFENFTNDAAGAGGNIILALTEDTKNAATQGNIWLGTLSEGIARFHPTLHTFETFRNNPTNVRSLANNVV
jgi:ligand-binding sensor domain-containing protein